MTREIWSGEQSFYLILLLRRGLLVEPRLASNLPSSHSQLSDTGVASVRLDRQHSPRRCDPSHTQHLISE